MVQAERHERTPVDGNSDSWSNQPQGIHRGRRTHMPRAQDRTPSAMGTSATSIGPSTRIAEKACVSPAKYTL